MKLNCRVVTGIQKEIQEESHTELDKILWVARQMYMLGYRGAMENYDELIRREIMEKQNQTVTVND